jgi:hypothetical protein
MLKKKKMLSIRFWLLKSESKTAHHFILQVSISYKGVRASAKSTGIVIERKEDFDETNQKILNDSAKEEQR